MQRLVYARKGWYMPGFLKQEVTLLKIGTYFNIVCVIVYSTSKWC